MHRRTILAGFKAKKWGDFSSPYTSLARNCLAICIFLCAALLILVFDAIIIDVSIAITRCS